LQALDFPDCAGSLKTYLSDTSPILFFANMGRLCNSRSMIADDYSFEEELCGCRMFFKTTYGLFSPRKVDAGSRLLIDCVTFDEGDTCLDFGCGYGAVGLVLAKRDPHCKIFFLDRDFVALEYTKINCQINGIENYELILSNGFNHCAPGLKVDNVVSHLPTHVSNDFLRLIIKDGKDRLNENGAFYVVTVSKLRNFISKQFNAVFGNCSELARNGLHTVCVAKRAGYA
jgi:16S rRNA (guanine1207-N2)-methyltransferase